MFRDAFFDVSKGCLQPSTLKRIKMFSRDGMGQDRLNALAVLSIHKNEIQAIRSFNDLVIEHFAAKKLDARSI